MRSYVPQYDLVCPGTLNEVLHLLASGGDWRPIAGGTDLMVLFNAGKLSFHRFVSVGQLPELSQIEVARDSVKIGAAATYTQIRNHSVLQNEFPMLCEAASWIGGIANQNRGTVGGNIANASPAADSSPVLLAYDADLHLASERGPRKVPYRSFHLDYKLCDLAPDELITAIELPRHPSHAIEYARKVGPRRAQAISKVCIAGRASLQGGVINMVRLAFGSVAPVPLRCHETEAAIIGRPITPALLVDAETALREEISPITDMRSTSEYRMQVSVNLLKNFLQSLQ